MKPPSPTIGEALLVVAHGDRGGLGGNLLAERIAERMAVRCSEDKVALAYIRGGPSISEALKGLKAQRIRVYPLFMSNGYYVKSAIPQQIEKSGWRGRWQVALPLGLDPDLPDVLAEEATTAIGASGKTPARCTLLLVAHGSSKSRASARAARRIAKDITRKSLFAGVETAFLEEAPYFKERLKHIEGPACVVGLFIGEGLHGGEDLPEAVAGVSRSDIILAPPLARSDRLLDIICRKII